MARCWGVSVKGDCMGKGVLLAGYTGIGLLGVLSVRKVVGVVRGYCYWLGGVSGGGGEGLRNTLELVFVPAG